MYPCRYLLLYLLVPTSSTSSFNYLIHANAKLWPSQQGKVALPLLYGVQYSVHVQYCTDYSKCGEKQRLLYGVGTILQYLEVVNWNRVSGKIKLYQNHKDWETSDDDDKQGNNDDNDDNNNNTVMSCLTKEHLILGVYWLWPSAYPELYAMQAWGDLTMNENISLIG